MFILTPIEHNGKLLSHVELVSNSALWYSLFRTCPLAILQNLQRALQIELFCTCPLAILQNLQTALEIELP